LWITGGTFLKIAFYSSKSSTGGLLSRPHGFLNRARRAPLCRSHEITRSPDRPVPTTTQNWLDNEVPDRPPERVLRHREVYFTTAFPDHGETLKRRSVVDREQALELRGFDLPLNLGIDVSKAV
jgi:hypothetical protein